MTKIDYRGAIKERAKELLVRERAQSKAFIRDRIRFLRLLKTGRCSSQIQAGGLIGLSARSSQRLWQQYQQGGLQALLIYPYRGTDSRLSKEQAEQLISKLRKDDIQFLHEAKDYIEQHFDICYSISGVRKLFKRMKVKKKTGRPCSCRKDEKGARVFKKSSLL